MRQSVGETTGRAPRWLMRGSRMINVFSVLFGLVNRTNKAKVSNTEIVSFGCKLVSWSAARSVVLLFFVAT